MWRLFGLSNKIIKATDEWLSWVLIYFNSMVG